MKKDARQIVDRYAAIPKYMKLAEEFRLRIEKGELQPGDRLPSFVELREQLGMGQSTLERAYALLEQDALIYREAGRGIFVAIPSRRRQTGVIGLWGITPVKAEHPYYSQLLSGVQHAAHGSGKEVLLLNDTQPLRSERLDGIVVYSSRPHLALERIVDCLPRVVVMTPTHETPSVVADNYGAVKAAMRHLFDLGHRRIAYLLARRNDETPRLRLDGYYDALREEGIVPDTRWLRTPTEEPSLSPDDIFRSFIVWGRNQMQEWLADDWDELGCTALLAQNDDAAIGVIQALTEAGRKVPDDLSVVGFDDTRVAQLFSPSLTTIRVPLREIGAKATSILIEQMNDDHLISKSVPENNGEGDMPNFPPCIMETPLIVRDSTGPARTAL
jgi:DNA-binding LacI/PurR family transcriptional regulator